MSRFHTAFNTHLGYYLSLSSILLLGFMLIAESANQPTVQLIAIIMMAFLYAAWGIIHHLVHHDTSTKIVVEYILIATLGIVVALLVFR